jgi:hypothetical protein
MSATKVLGLSVPRLPQFPEEYTPEIQEMYSNVLRLYFDKLNGAVNALSVGTLSANRSSTGAQTVTIYTVAKLPSAVTTGIGVRSFVSDALTPTFGATVVGGGSIPVPIYSDGTNWKVG